MVTTQSIPAIQDLPAEEQVIKTSRNETISIPKRPRRKEWPASCDWPQNIIEAYRRGRGPYRIDTTWALLEEERLELFNGWLVWQDVTDFEDRRLAANLQDILSLAARAASWGQAYPDQLQCEMKNGDVQKPDLALVSNAQAASQVYTLHTSRGDRLVLKGSPELVIEIRSPSNTRKEERRKRTNYFANGTLAVWDVVPRQRRIIVYETPDYEEGRSYELEAEISCEAVLPGWRRKVDDFFRDQLSAEEIAGEMAVQWRAESRQEGREQGLAEGEQIGREQGRAEGERLALRKILLRQVQRRYGAEQLPVELEIRLSQYSAEQLTELADNLVLTFSLSEWMVLLERE